MLRATLDQMRSSAGRLAAAGLAILLGTAFVAAALLASATMQQATEDAFTASYADADLVVTTGDEPVARDTVTTIRESDGVAAADLLASFGLELTGPGATEFVSVGPTPSAPELAIGSIEEGRYATADDEIVLAHDVADRLDAGIGDSVQGSVQEYSDDGGGAITAVDLTVVGILADAGSFFAMTDGGLVTASTMDSWVFDASGTDEYWGSLLLALDDGADVETVREALRAEPGLGSAQIQTVPEIAAEQTAAQTGSNVTFLVLVLAFAAVALAVAALVITNTFQVLVAQRTRTLALLRCVGASRGQIRRSVLFEALVLGLLASLAGLALGAGVVIGGVRVLADVFPAASLGTTVPFSPVVAVVTLAVGVGVTLMAALVPARMATRVAPVAALRPVEGTVDAGAGSRRRVLAIGAGVVGAAMLAGGVALALATAGTETADTGVLGGLALGVIGGLLSLCGILIGSVFLVPRLLPLLGRLVGRGVPARIATANAVRNPRRTAATTNALVIGVALVVMMSTGAFSARQTLTSTLDSSFPVDVAAISPDRTREIQPSQIEAVTTTDGVASVVTVRVSDMVTLEVPDGYGMSVDATTFADGDPAAVLRDADVLAPLTDSVVVANSSFEQMLGIESGTTAQLTGPEGSVEVEVVLADLGGQYTVYLTPALQAQLAPDVAVNGVWAQIADGADPVDVATRVQSALNDLSSQDANVPVLEVGGAAIERAAYGQVIDTLLAVVLGLLAVAVVIALVGVANTLSLSVLERRRENATLRAMGLTRGQLRGMLATEGVLIAAVGALVGVVAGLLYGWAGASIVLGGLGGGAGLQLGVPWPQLAAIAVVALLAGLLASVLPSRSAVRQSPVAALATD